MLASVIIVGDSYQIVLNSFAILELHYRYIRIISMHMHALYINLYIIILCHFVVLYCYCIGALD